MRSTLPLRVVEEVKTIPLGAMCFPANTLTRKQTAFIPSFYTPLDAVAQSLGAFLKEQQQARLQIAVLIICMKNEDHISIELYRVELIL